MTLDTFNFFMTIYERLLIDDKQCKWDEFNKIIDVIIVYNPSYTTNDINNFKHIILITDEPIFKNVLLQLITSETYLSIIIIREYLKLKYDEETCFKILEEFVTIMDYYFNGSYIYIYDSIIEYINSEKRKSPCKTVSTLATMQYVKSMRVCKKKDDYDDLPF